MLKPTLSPFAALLLATLLAAPLLAADADTSTADAPVATISPDELVRGQIGYGYTVFAGGEPERFEVEVIGVQRNASAPESASILAVLRGHGLERSGVAAGMSGSPVYFDGRLAGAVAFSYLFALDALAGITPIDAMHDLHRIADPALANGSPVGAARAATSDAPGEIVSWRDLLRRDLGADLLDTFLDRLRPPGFAAANGERAAAVQWTASGFGGEPAAWLRDTLGAVPAGAVSTGAVSAGTVPASLGAGTGAAAPDDASPPAELVPGSAVAAVLVDGDLQLAAHGTVTDRRGDQIVAFGHPLFGLGPISLPMAHSEVLTVVASRFNSFKQSNTGPIVGLFDQDRSPGARGWIGREAAMIPLRVRVTGPDAPDGRVFDMRVADLPQLSPILVGTSALGALRRVSYAGGPQGLDLEARFRLAGYEDLVIRQSFDGADAATESLFYLLGFAAFLELNELEDVRIEGIEVDYTQVLRPRLATVLGAHALRSRAAPGETVPIIVDLQPYRGPREQIRLETTIPEGVEDGAYVLLLGDGTSMDAVRLSVERKAPQTLPQILDLLRSFRPRDELRVLGLVRGAGLAMAGESLPRLPGSVRAVLSGGGGEALGLAIVREETHLQGRPLDGLARIDLEIRRRP